MDIIKKGFGSRLKFLRKFRNLTQEKLAEAIEVNLRQLARIEAGESFVSSETLLKICSVLEVSPKILFDFDLQEETLMTGTGDKVHCSVIKSGNIIQILPEQFGNTEDKKAELPKSESFENKMSEISKRLKKEVYVDEVKDGQIILTKIFKPNGDIETLSKNNSASLYEDLKNKILNIANDSKKIEFMNLAYSALTSSIALNELKILIKGIELTQK